MSLTEREEKIVNYMSELIGTGLEKIESSARDMIKYNTGILTLLTALATYFNIDIKYVILPIVFISIGIIAFIFTIQPIEINYIVGEVDSSVNAYEETTKRKHISLKIGYYSTYIGFIWFVFVIIA